MAHGWQSHGRNGESDGAMRAHRSAAATGKAPNDVQSLPCRADFFGKKAKSTRHSPGARRGESTEKPLKMLEIFADGHNKMAMKTLPKRYWTFL
ncbi:MAG: hypothetical protein LUF91_07275 [Oscillospiraceae bacterium]|nr:hypothetical protein [Oscillospiraceae bacterium]